jgi:hypothetical protein
VLHRPSELAGVTGNSVAAQFKRTCSLHLRAEFNIRKGCDERLRRCSTSSRKLNKSERVQREHPGISWSNVLYERGDLHELYCRTYTVEAGYSLEKLIGEERFSCVL